MYRRISENNKYTDIILYHGNCRFSGLLPYTVTTAKIHVDTEIQKFLSNSFLIIPVTRGLNCHSSHFIRLG